MNVNEQSNQTVRKCVKCESEFKDTFFGYSACICGGYYVPLIEYGIYKQKYVSHIQSLIPLRRKS